MTTVSRAPEGAKEGLAALVLRLRGMGITSPALVKAVEETPRTAFVPAGHADIAYSDRMIPIDCGETMEGAETAVRLIHHLDLQPELRVLEVGTGSGFTAGVMARLVKRVISLDRYRSLLSAAQRRYETLGITNIVLKQADGIKGLPAEGPFDRVLVTAAFEEEPRHFLEQLTARGVLIAPIGKPDEAQTMAKFIKLGSRFEREDLFPVRLQPLVPSVAAAL